MSQAVITLLAVLLGAALTVAGQLLVQRHHDEARMFAAARVLLATIFQAIIVIDESVERDRFTFGTQLVQRLLADWPEQRPALAEHLDEDEWTVIKDAFEALAQLQELREQAGEDPRGPLSADTRERLEACRGRLAGRELESPTEILVGYTDETPIRRRAAMRVRELLSATVRFAGRNRA